jgi:hypothetical protein
MFNTLADRAGIGFPEQDISKSFANEDFIDTTRWILGGNDVLYRYKDL